MPALTWQFMSCALVMYTLVPGGERRRVAGGPKLPHTPHGQAHFLEPLPNNSRAPGQPCQGSGKDRDGGTTVHGAPTSHRSPHVHVELLPAQPAGCQKEQAAEACTQAPMLRAKFLTTVQFIVTPP